MNWHKFGSKPKSSLTAEELKRQIEQLRKTEDMTRDYADLQNEKEKILRKIKKEGWHIRHRKALNALHRIERDLLFASKKTGESLVHASRKAKPYVRKSLKAYRKYQKKQEKYY